MQFDLIHCDRRRYSNARGLQALPRPLLTRPFRRACLFFSSIYIFFLAVQHFCCSSRRQHSPLLRPAGPATRAGAGRHGATGLRGQVSSATSPCERRIHFSRTPFGVLRVHTSTPAGCCFGTWYADFSSRYRQQFWSGCISLHQAPRISCPLDLVVRIYLCGECFSLFHSTLLEGDRAVRGRSFFIEKRVGF